MIKIITGQAGEGKTKWLIDVANEKIRSFFGTDFTNVLLFGDLCTNLHSHRRNSDDVTNLCDCALWLSFGHQTRSHNRVIISFSRGCRHSRFRRIWRILCLFVWTDRRISMGILPFYVFLRIHPAYQEKYTENSHFLLRSSSLSPTRCHLVLTI